ncbi:N-acetylmuramoyl-L-alanine amidase [bacterium]|nr:N-acetylmuramoyl-L-alanine amidase [candidate division CSSED10-310 bacterium]
MVDCCRVNRLSTAWLLFLPVFFSTGVHAEPFAESISNTATAILLSRELYLEISETPVDACRDATRLYVDNIHHSNTAFRKKKGFRSRSPVYRYNWSQLTCQGKREVIRSLFPKDSLTPAGWIHTVAYSGSDGETLWRIAAWFTGSGANSSRIAKKNKVNPQKLAIGQTLIIETDLLDPCFAQTVSYPITVDALTYRMDSSGVVAEYRLLSGQTIYSLVLRYTPRITAADVMEASRMILERSGLSSFRTIPANYLLKIPEELISPQFLPENHPRRMQFEATVFESSQFKPKQTARLLRGVTVILDAGHGGVDPGAIGKGGIKEDEYAYDVMCRVKRILKDETEAVVFCTILDDETGYTPRNDRLLSSGKDAEKVLTTPAYPIDDAGTALNLRWFLANYVFTKQCPSDSRDEKTIFTSFHADSLHPSASGMMIYIPGADYYSGSTRKTERVYTSRKEVKGRNAVSQSRSDRLKSEGFSRSFADRIEARCRQMDITMHSAQPTRKYVIRKGHAWVPALLRYCRIPTRLLIELANLQNSNDVERIKDPAFREKLARMYVESLKDHFADTKE